LRGKQLPGLTPKPQAQASNDSDKDQAVASNSALNEVETALTAGPQIARDCGFGLYHIDLLLQRARQHLLRGNPDAALADIELALDTGIPADPVTGQQELLAANDECCGYPLESAAPDDDALTPSDDSEVNMTFDVFLSHNSKDKPAIRQLGEALRGRGFAVWLDEWELVPGRPWQLALEEIIRTTKSAVVAVGADGLGPWEEPETRACLSEFVDRRLPVIPVLLPGAPTQPELPLFLKAFTWVDLRGGVDEAGLDRVQWGITGQKPTMAAAPAASTTPPPAAPVTQEAPGGPLATWQEKLQFLQAEEAITADPAQKLALKKQIEEAEQKIRELGG
jgi:hypothetical protein